MEYLNLIQETIDYIDEHIIEKITVEQLANIAGFSTYHYYKIFYKFVGMPVMEYVTRRRLQYALYELSQEKKIIDIAMKYGFDTHAGFTRAFKKTFGYPPSFYRAHAPVGFPHRVDLSNLENNKTGGIIMEPKIMTKEAFKIIGYKFKTTLKNNAHSRDIPAFWNECNIDGKEAKLYATQKPRRHGEYGICFHPNLENDEFFYMLGIEVSSFDHVLEEMSTLEIPSATYAVFTTPSVKEDNFVASIQGTWKYILEEWFPNSKYTIDDAKLDFEFYDERCHPWETEELSMEIYLPIKTNSTLT